MLIVRPRPAALAREASLELDDSLDLGVGATPAAPARDASLDLVVGGPAHGAPGGSFFLGPPMNRKKGQLLVA
jgi:hypothetical protein